MASHGRSNRSSSIPTPRNIEAALPLSFGTSPGSLSRSRPTGSVDGLGIRGHVSLAGSSPSSSRHTPSRSFTTPHPISSSPIEPRRIRPAGAVGPSRSVDDGSPAHISPILSRRRSLAGSSTSTGRLPGIGAGRTPSYRAPSATYTPPATSSPSAVAFTPPSYLSHSSLRHLLQTEAPPSLPPSRYANPDASVSLPNVVWPLVKNRENTPMTDSEDESPPPRELGPLPSVLISSSPILRLPTRWSDQDRNPALSVLNDGRDLNYTGSLTSGSNAEKDAAAARTNHPIPPACGIYYYEIEILNKGSRGGITVGLAAGQVRLSRIPGWEAHSWGYRGEDGLAFAAEKTGTPYGPKFEDRDIIGCGIDFTQHRAFFTRNGRFLGNVFEDVGKDCDVYPCVSLRQANESIRVNFGHEPFKFDIDDYVQQQRNLVWANIQNTPITHSLLGRFNDHADSSPSQLTENSSVEGREGKDAERWGGSDLEEVERVRIPLGRLVLEYLEHHGYARTARAFKKQFERQGRDDILEDTYSGGKAPVPVPVPGASRSIDEDSAMTDLTTPTQTSSYPIPSTSSSCTYTDDLDARLCIVNAVIAGDIDTAISMTARQFPSVLAGDEGLMLVKLRCRKFVELVLAASEAMRRMKEEERRKEREEDVMAIVGPMDIDGDDGDALQVPAPGTNGYSLGTRTLGSGDAGASGAHVSVGATNGSGNGTVGPEYASASPSTTGVPPPLSLTATEYQSALSSALSYGQKLRSDYKADGRSEVQALFKRTFGIVAYDDPASAGPEVAEIVGPEAKAALANELNIAILKSQGRPSHPALEQLYRQAAACVEQLGLVGVGVAAFADAPKEFLEN